jgi:hypothetical protein
MKVWLPVITSLPAVALSLVSPESFVFKLSKNEKKIQITKIK